MGRETTPSESQVGPPGIQVRRAQDSGSQDWCWQKRSSHNWKQTQHSCELQPDCPVVLAKAMECLLEGERERWDPDVGSIRPEGPIWLLINILTSASKEAPGLQDGQTDSWWGMKGLQIEGTGNGLSQGTPASKQKRGLGWGQAVGAGQGLAWVWSCWQTLLSPSPPRKPCWVLH